MGRYCIDVRGKEKKKKTTSRIRYIYTVYVTKSTVILMNSVIIIVWYYPGKAMAPHCSPLARKIPWTGGAWWAAVHGVAHSRTRLSDFPCAFHFHALEADMATHCSVLAWRIPGTGVPGGLPSVGSHRFGHDRSDAAAAAATWLKSLSVRRIYHLFSFFSMDQCLSVILVKLLL